MLILLGTLLLFILLLIPFMFVSMLARAVWEDLIEHDVNNIKDKCEKEGKEMTVKDVYQDGIYPPELYDNMFP